MRMHESNAGVLGFCSWILMLEELWFVQEDWLWVHHLLRMWHRVLPVGHAHGLIVYTSVMLKERRVVTPPAY